MPKSRLVMDVLPGETKVLPSTALTRFSPASSPLAEVQTGKKQTRYGYKVSSLNFLIPASTGSEVIRLVELSPIPHSLKWLKGILNLRGNLVPVFDLALLMDLQGHKASDNLMVLIFDQGDKAVGIIADGFPQVVTSMKKLDILPQLPTPLEGFVTSGYMQDQALWLELDHERFFSAFAKAGPEQN